jgi:hypothetical protein
MIFKGNFTGRYWYIDGDDKIVFEEYINESFGENSIR